VLKGENVNVVVGTLVDHLNPLGYARITTRDQRTIEIKDELGLLVALPVGHRVCAAECEQGFVLVAFGGFGKVLK